MTRARSLAVHLLAATLCVSSGPASAELQVSAFAGRQVSNGWQDVFTQPHDLDWRRSGIAGVAMGRDWPLAGPVSVGIEVQAAVHFGEQNHGEFNLPVFVRYAPDAFGPLASLAFGMGPSYATEVPPIEVETRNGSARTLLYWAVEAEFAVPSPDTFLFLRLHHRSNGFGYVAEHGGSNVLVMGLRRRW